MRTPEFTGPALANLVAITAPESDFTLWRWGPSLYPLKKDETTVQRLKDEGYTRVQRVEGKFSLAHLFSQCCDLVALRNDKSHYPELWARTDDLEHITKYPVTLAFKLEDISLEGEKIIPMLQPLPFPSMGEWALVSAGGNAFYRMDQLPQRAQKLKARLGAALIDLAEPAASWMAYSELCALCADESVYLDQVGQLQNALETLKGKDKSITEAMLNRLEETHETVTRLRRSWHRKDWLSKWSEIRRMSQELAQEYFEYHERQQQRDERPPQSSEQQPQLFTIPKTPKPKRPRVVPNYDEKGMAPIVASLPMQAVINSVNNASSGADRWVFDEQSLKAPVFIDRKKDSTIKIEYNHLEQGLIVQDQHTAAQLWREVKSFDDETNDIILDIFSHLSRNGQDGRAWFFASEFLDHRSLAPITKEENGKRRRAGHRKEDMLPIDATIRKLENIWLIINQIIEAQDETPGGKKRRSRRKWTHTGRLLAVTQKWYQSELTGEEGLEIESQRYPIGWYIHAGEWLQTFLEQPNYQVTKLCNTLLRYDPYRKRHEKRIGRYLMFHGHMQCKGNGGKLTRKISTILEEVSLMPPLDTHNKVRIRERFEQALNQLEEDHLIDHWKYDEELGDHRTNWLPNWLDTHITFYIAPTKTLVHV